MPRKRRMPQVSGLSRRAVRRVGRAVRPPVQDRTQRRAVYLLAMVLALNAADLGVIGALAPQLRDSFGVGNTEIGLLVALSSAVGALSTVPAGWLADRVRRTPLLAGGIALWSVAMIAQAFAASYLWLLLARIGLGAVIAVAGPVTASLIGDFFAPRDRARLYGYVLSGELVGAGLGLIGGGGIAVALGWRATFWALALAGVLLAAVVWRALPEPSRGGAGAGSPAGGEPGHDEVARLVARDAGATPHAGASWRAADRSWWAAIRYVLGIRTNLILIAASATGYFFFAGLRTFAVLFAQQHYGLGRAEIIGLLPLVGAAALAGVLGGGRLADRLTRGGRLTARVVVPGSAYCAATACFAGGLLTGDAFVALPFLMATACALAAANPPLDAARLDIVRFTVWGRAESVRTVLRTGAEALAPLLFGYLSDLFAGGGRERASGLTPTFAIMLAPLLVSGLLVLRARSTYPADVAAAQR